MRVVVQRVSNASVTIDKRAFSSIDAGLLILVGFESSDTTGDLIWIGNKITQMRIFNDENGVMNLSVKEINGELLVVSQFTLHAKTKKGNRPSYINAAPPEIAVLLYNEFVGLLNRLIGKEIKTGKFGANMQVSLLNDGPVTIIIDSKNKDL